MISIFIREQKGYTLNYLCELFRCDEDKTVRILHRLKDKNVLKIKSNSINAYDLTDLIEEDLIDDYVDVNSNDALYVFSFVGILIIEGIVLKCYPKYIQSKQNPTVELAQVLRVVSKFYSKSQSQSIFIDMQNDSTYNHLSVILYLLHDYYDYGIYTNTQDIIETNGHGEINWDKTINGTFAIISQNRPYYPELQTRKRINDNLDYFKRLHETVLTCCSRELREAGLIELFDLIEVDISAEDIEEFGDNEYIQTQLERELNVQYNTRKQQLLKALQSYISNRASLSDYNATYLYGTSSFNLIWEKICKDVLNNQLEKPLKSLPIPHTPNDNPNNTLLDLIEKPIWISGHIKKTADKSLIPDIVSIKAYESTTRFIISDAKYYVMQLEEDKKLQGQPGIESITKQYLYQLAFKEFTSSHGINSIKNCFLMPTEEPDIIDKGEVQMNMLHNVGLENIKVRLLPAKQMYSYYLQNRKMDLSMLNLA